MKTTKRFLLTLAAILGMTGAWAQDAEEVAVSETANNNEWTLTMPASGCYDLSGRKIVNSKSVNGKLQKGVYIVNGKKVVIR